MHTLLVHTAEASSKGLSPPATSPRTISLITFLSSIPLSPTDYRDIELAEEMLRRSKT